MYSPPIICRVCTLSHKPGNLTHIFQYYKFYRDSMEIYKVISDCASVQIEKDDDYSQLICTKCLNHLCQAYSFKVLCEESDKKMRKKPIKKTVAERNKITDKIVDGKANSEINKTEDNPPTFTEPPEIKSTLQLNKIVNEKDSNENYEPPVIKKEASDDSTNAESYEIKCEFIEEETKITYGSLEQRPQQQSKQFNTESPAATQETRAEAKQFKCDLCNISFKKAESLIIHNKVHTKCDICCESFKLMKDLQNHKTNHFSFFKAKTPGKSGQINKRAKTHAPLIRFRCDICNLLCKNLSQFSQHRRTHDVSECLADVKDTVEASLAPKVKIKRIR